MSNTQDELQELLADLLGVGYKLGQAENILGGGKEVGEAKQAILNSYISKAEVRKVATHEIAVTKSLCGCPMCTYHTEAFNLSEKETS